MEPFETIPSVKHKKLYEEFSRRLFHFDICRNTACILNFFDGYPNF